MRCPCARACSDRLGFAAVERSLVLEPTVPRSREHHQLRPAPRGPSAPREGGACGLRVAPPAPTGAPQRKAPSMPRKTTHAPPPDRGGRAKGAGGSTPADRLIRAWLDGDQDGFEDLAEELIAGGRDGVLAAAVRKLAERYEEDAVEDFADDLAEVAEAAEGQREFDFASLVLLPVVAGGGPPPNPARLASGLAASGAFPPEAGVAFAAGWRTAEAVQALSPCAVRR